METFSEIRNHMLDLYELKIDEPFIISFEYPIDDSERLQSMFLAELKTDHGRRVLRVETPVAPLADLDAEKCLRINLTQRVGYLAVGDLEGVPYIKMCENLPYVRRRAGTRLRHPTRRAGRGSHGAIPRAGRGHYLSRP